MGYNPHFRNLRLQVVAGFPRSPCCLNNPPPVPLPTLGGPAPTLSRLESLPRASALHPPPTSAHQLLWLLPSWCCLGFNFCAAVRKLPIITALRGNVSWRRPCSQLWPPQTQSWGRLQGPPARILAPSKAPHFNEKGAASISCGEEKPLSGKPEPAFPSTLA